MLHTETTECSQSTVHHEFHHLNWYRLFSCYSSTFNTKFQLYNTSSMPLLSFSSILWISTSNSNTTSRCMDKEASQPHLCIRKLTWILAEINPHQQCWTPDCLRKNNQVYLPFPTFSLYHTRRSSMKRFFLVRSSTGRIHIKFCIFSSLIDKILLTIFRSGKGLTACFQDKSVNPVQLFTQSTGPLQDSPDRM